MNLTFVKDSSIDIQYERSSNKYLITYKNKILIFNLLKVIVYVIV